METRKRREFTSAARGQAHGSRNADALPSHRARSARSTLDLGLTRARAVSSDVPATDGERLLLGETDVGRGACFVSNRLRAGNGLGVGFVGGGDFRAQAVLRGRWQRLHLVDAGAQLALAALDLKKGKLDVREIAWRRRCDLDGEHGLGCHDGLGSGLLHVGLMPALATMIAGQGERSQHVGDRTRCGFDAGLHLGQRDTPTVVGSGTQIADGRQRGKLMREFVGRRIDGLTHIGADLGTGLVGCHGSGRSGRGRLIGGWWRRSRSGNACFRGRGLGRRGGGRWRTGRS